MDELMPRTEQIQVLATAPEFLFLFLKFPFIDQLSYHLFESLTLSLISVGLPFLIKMRYNFFYFIFHQILSV